MTSGPARTRLLLALWSLAAIGCSHSTSETGTKPTDTDTAGAVWTACSDAPIVSMSVGYLSTCALRSDGCMDCAAWQPPVTTDTADYADWHRYWHDHGQADAPTGDFLAVSVSQGEAREVMDDNAIYREPQWGTCAVDTGGGAVCWGWPYDDDHDGYWVEPPDSGLVEVATGFEHACGLGADGLATCWGECRNGACAAPAEPLTSLVSGHDFSCGLDAARLPVCWGYDEDVSFTSRDDPEYAPHWAEAEAEWEADGPYDTMISAPDYACGVRVDGGVACSYQFYWDVVEFDLGTMVVDVVPLYRFEGAYAVAGLTATGELVTAGDLTVVTPVDLLQGSTYAKLASSDRVCGLDAAGSITCEVSGTPSASDYAYCPFCTELFTE